jgi:hypothetical protein
MLPPAGSEARWREEVMPALSRWEDEEGPVANLLLIPFSIIFFL